MGSLANNVDSVDRKILDNIENKIVITAPHKKKIGKYHKYFHEVPLGSLDCESVKLIKNNFFLAKQFRINFLKLLKGNLILL